MIQTFMPYALDKNLGHAYNEAMQLLPDDAWAVFLDHDAMWTTREWYRQLEEAIRFKPDAGAFTAMTNRIWSDWQRTGNRNIHDMIWHRRYGQGRLRVRTLLDVTDTAGMGGVVMCLSKRAWQLAGGFVNGMLCVDHHMHQSLRDAGYRIWLIEGLYVYHWRRAQGDELPANVPRASGCRCHQPYPKPSHRETLPGQLVTSRA